MIDPVTTYVLHPLHGNGYQWWSGLGSDLGELSILAAVLMFWRQHTCHVHNCFRLSWHPHPKHGHPVCKKHHPQSNGTFLDASNH